MGRKNATTKQSSMRKPQKKSYKRRHQLKRALIEKLKDQSEENDRIYGALKESHAEKESNKVAVPDVSSGSPREQQHVVVESVSKSIDRVVAAMREL